MCYLVLEVKKVAGTGWNVPNRQRMTPEEAAAKAQTAHRQTNTVLLCGERSTPLTVWACLSWM